MQYLHNLIQFDILTQIIDINDNSLKQLKTNRYITVSIWFCIKRRVTIVWIDYSEQPTNVATSSSWL